MKERSDRLRMNIASSFSERDDGDGDEWVWYSSSTSQGRKAKHGPRGIGGAAFIACQHIFTPPQA